MVNVYGTPVDPAPAPTTAREAAAIAGAAVGFRGSYGGASGQAAQDYRTLQAWNAAQQQQQQQQQQQMKYQGWEQQQIQQQQEQRTYAQQALIDRQKRPGYTDPATLGDINTETMYRHLQVSNQMLGMMGMPTINPDRMIGSVLASQQEAAFKTPGTRDDMFFSGELQKWGQNYVETEAAYQNLSRQADVPIPRSPFEFQSDMARSFLMGNESNSPVNGVMSRYLPGGQGVQQDAWDRAVQTYRGQNNTDRPAMKFMGWEGQQPPPVSYAAAVDVLGSSSGTLWDPVIGTTSAPAANRTAPAFIKQVPFNAPAAPDEPIPSLGMGMLQGFVSDFGNRTGGLANPFGDVVSQIQGNATRTDPFKNFIQGFGFAGNKTPTDPLMGSATPDKGTVDFLKKFAGIAGVTSMSYGTASLPMSAGTPFAGELLASNPIGWGILAGGLAAFGMEATGNLGLFGEGRVRQAGYDYMGAWNTRMAEDRQRTQSLPNFDNFVSGYLGKMTERTRSDNTPMLGAGIGLAAISLMGSGSGMYGGSETPTRSPSRSELPGRSDQYSERPAYYPPVSEIPAQKRSIIEIYGTNNPNKNKNKNPFSDNYIDELGQEYPNKNPNRSPVIYPYGNQNPTDTGNPFGIGNPNPNKNPNKNDTDNPVWNPYQYPVDTPTNNPYRFDYQNPNQPGEPGYKIDFPNLPIIGFPWGGSSAAGSGAGGKKYRPHRETMNIDSWLDQQQIKNSGITMNDFVLHGSRNRSQGFSGAMMKEILGTRAPKRPTPAPARKAPAKGRGFKLW